MTSEFLVRLPIERIAVLIGPNGTTRKRIEELTGCKLKIDSNSGDVIIIADEDLEDPINLWKARDMVKAIGRGFSPTKAYQIIEPNIFEMISLREEVGNSPNALRNVRARIIGRKGSTRNFIEHATKTHVSVYHNTVSIIGELKKVEIARSAILKLIRGAKHGSVYSYIENEMRAIKDGVMNLWASGSEGDVTSITDLDELERIIFDSKEEDGEKK